jgi:hypothetical protein
MNQRTPYTQQWNAASSRNSGKHDFELAYVGNRGLKLPAFRNLNQLPVLFNAVGAPERVRVPWLLLA